MKNNYIKRKIILLIFIVFIFSTIIPLVNSSYQILLESKNSLNPQSKGDILYVGGSGPDNYSSIQEAVNAAQNEDTIFVYNGTYREYIVINKMITLIGEKKETTIIEGSFTDNCVKISADSVIVTGFTIRKGLIGVYILKSLGHKIKNNIIRKNWEGIGLFQTIGTEISYNSISENYFEGINPVQSNYNNFTRNEINWNLYGLLLTSSNNNFVYENEIKGHTRGIETVEQSTNNKIYHNNFYASEEDNADDDFSNTWDDDYPSGGNYWDDYTGSDNDGDGIGDTAYNIPGDGNNKDRYPLMEPYVPQNPPETPIITGPTSGIPGVEYTFCISNTVDPEGDRIYVFWDWDDGTTSGWLGPYDSGEVICNSHKWNETGIYVIKAKLKDENGEESGWGTLTVIMPRNRAINIWFINFLQKYPRAFPLLRYVQGLR